MSRIPKNNINTPFLHIMIQGNNKNFIFENTNDKQKYLKILKETKKEIDVPIIAYCIMGNHTHLLFYIKNMDNLIKFMHKTNLLYAKFYNEKYDRVGYVFRDRYKVQPIMSERHLFTCIDYIHNNPVKGGICSKMSDYPYSSYNRNMFSGNSEIEVNLRKYIDSKKSLYKNEKYNDFVLLEDEDNPETKEDIANNLIDRYLAKNNMKLEDLRNNNELVVKITKRLKDKYNISYRITSKVIGIGRDKLRLLVSKSDKEVRFKNNKEQNKND